MWQEIPQCSIERPSIKFGGCIHGNRHDNGPAHKKEGIYTRKQRKGEAVDKTISGRCKSERCHLGN